MLLKWGVLFSNCLNSCTGLGRRWSWPRLGCRRVGCGWCPLPHWRPGPPWGQTGTAAAAGAGCPRWAGAGNWRWRWGAPASTPDCRFVSPDLRSDHWVLWLSHTWRSASVWRDRRRQVIAEESAIGKMKYSSRLHLKYNSSRDLLPHWPCRVWPRTEKQFTFLKTWRLKWHSGFLCVCVFVWLQK